MMRGGRFISRNLWSGLAPVFLLGLLLGFSQCGSPGDEALLSEPMVRFAVEQIGDQRVDFILDTATLAPQAYRVEVSGRKPMVYGGDARGLMYGGLEVAEQLRLYGEVEACEGAPFLEKRGIKFNIPLDARTPSYDDSGDAAQENIDDMWDWDFWEEFLDRMATHRYNALSLWNPHPFPSMIKLEDYPEVALDDVCRTTLEPVGRENEWGDPGLVTSNVMANLEVVKEMDIDEKIAFWQKVMQHAADRGIDVYWINWNLCANSVAPPVEPYYKTYRINLGVFEEGKHGITYEMSNPITIDYYRQAVKQFLLTYPTVKGIGVTAGEHMPLSWEGYNREKWLWETYGEGILDAKKEQPGRSVDFIHRVWHSDMDQIMHYWKDYPDRFEVSFKYAKARLYSSADLPFADSHVEEMIPYGLKSWWNLRNDDIFVYRWADAEYVRAFLRNFPREHTAGYHMGSDGYVWGREFVSRDPELAGQLEMEKHSFRYLLWGRLGYDNGLDRGRLIDWLEAEYGLGDAYAFYETWKTASGIIPLVNRYHWRDWDHHWAVEGCMARPVLGGYRDVFDFMDNGTLENSGLVNPRDFVAGKGSGKEGPLEVAASLREMAGQVLNAMETLGSESNDIVYIAVLQDMRAQAHLGMYYAAKIEAATSLAAFEAERLAKSKEAALAALEESARHWSAYSEISEAMYRPQMLARTNMLDWSALGDSIQAEIERLQNFNMNKN